MKSKSLTMFFAGLAAMGSYTIGCSGDEESKVSEATATEVGGQGGAGGTGGVGGTVGGAGGSDVLDCTDIPDYLCDIEGETSEEFMEVAKCIVEKHEAMVSADSRTGYLMSGTEGCGACKAERKEIGPEAMVYLAKHGVYHDPGFDVVSSSRVIDFGIYYVPMFAISKGDLFPTTENPEGVFTDLRRRREGFGSLQELADLADCEYTPAANTRMKTKEEVIKEYGSLKTKIDYKEVAQTLLTK